MAWGRSISIEQPNYHVAQTGKEYFSFWVRFNFGTEYFASSGWKYFPQENKVTTPSQMKGPGHFFNTSKVSAGIMREIVDAATKYFEPIIRIKNQQPVDDEAQETPAAAA
jgi:hypothetical protein